MKTLGIVGFGGMGEFHARQLKQMADVHVAVVVDPDGKNLERARTLFARGETKFSLNLESVLEEGVDGWIVASTTATHIQITRTILEAGGCILLEKPIAATASEALTLAPLVDADSKNLMMGHTLLWHRQFQLLTKELKNRGPIRAIHATRPRSADHRTRYPGETPFSLTMVHDLYTVFALVGGAQPKKLSAQQREHQLGGVDVAHAQLTWPDGVLAGLQADYLIPNDAAADVAGDELEISGDGWSIRLPYDKGFLEVVEQSEVTKIKCELPERVGVTNFYEDAVRSELEHFIALLNDNAAVPIGARYQDACQIQEWIDILIKLAKGDD